MAGLVLAAAPAAFAGTVTYTHTLTVTVPGEGHVVSTPAGIDCPGTCTVTETHTTQCPGECKAESAFDWGSFVLEASDGEEGWAPFWTGCDTFPDDGTCELTLDGNRTVKLDWYDNETPNISSFTVPPKVRNSATLTAVATDNDAVEEVDFYLGSQLLTADDEAPYTTTVDTSALSDATGYEVRAVALDAQGNKFEYKSRFSVDHRADVLGFVLDYIGRTFAAPVFLFPDGDVQTMTCWVDNDAPAPCSSPWSPAFAADGQHTVNARVTDDVGNTGSWSRTTILDRTDPVLDFTSGPGEDDDVPGPDVTFTFAQTEANPDRLICLVDGQRRACTSDTSLVLTGLTDGEHEVEIDAIDRASNITRIARGFTVGDEPEPVTVSSVRKPQVVVRAKVLARATRLSAFAIRNVVAGSRLVVRCAGASCPVERSVLNGVSGTIALDDYLHHTLRPGVTLRLTLTRKRAKTLRWTVSIRRGSAPRVVAR